MTKSINVWMMFDNEGEPIKDMNGIHITGDKKDVEYHMTKKTDNVQEAIISWQKKEEEEE